MGAIKPNNYSQKEIELSMIARAMAHPARIQMIQTLKSHTYFRNTDFVSQLRLSKSTVSDHLTKLKDAELIHIDYHPHFYSVSLNEKKLIHLSGFIGEN